jgi:hypothetical protein
MTNNIAWLDDEPSTIEPFVEFLEKEKKFKVRPYKDGTKLVYEALNRTELDAFILDLRAPESNRGIEIAEVLMNSRPDAPIVAVTQYLEESASELVTGITMAKQSPFSLFWEKKILNDSTDNLKKFESELEMICRREYHHGEVQKVEPDYTLIKLYNAHGEEYTRYFESAFLQSCKISKPGEKVGILFWKVADGKVGEVHVRITKTGDVDNDGDTNEIKEMISKLDMNKIRKKFPHSVKDNK